MKAKRLVIALAAAFTGSAAAPALALNVTAGTLPTDNLYMSGATAQDIGIEKNIALLCERDLVADPTGNTSTMDAYALTADVGAVANRVYVCRANATTLPGLAGTILAIRKASGGSGQGVTPLVGAGTTVNYLNINALATNVGGLQAVCTLNETVVDAGVNVPTYKVWRCGAAATEAVKPQLGFTDVEPCIVSQNAVGCDTLAPIATAGVIFGIPVTKSLYDALKTAQGLSLANDDEANVPSLTRAQVAGILASGSGFNSWDQFNLSNVAFNATDGTGGNTIFIARRIISSGTQAFAEVFFLGARCGLSNALSPRSGVIFGGTNAVQATSTVNGCADIVPGIPAVMNGNGSGDVVACLNQWDKLNRWGVGILTTENQPNSLNCSGTNVCTRTVGTTTATETFTNTGADGFRFVRINGALPSILNAMKSKYDYVAESTAQTSVATGVTVPAFAAAVLANVTSPGGIRVVDNGLNTNTSKALVSNSPGNGWGGLIALWNASTATIAYPSPPYTETTARTAPFLAKSRAIVGLNNCLPPVETVPSGKDSPIQTLDANNY